MNPIDLANGQLAQNIMHFGRALRSAGIPVGPGQVITAMSAVKTIGIKRRDDFYWTLHATMINRREHQDLFDQAFHVFWKNPRLLEKMLSTLLPTSQFVRQPQGTNFNRRISDALFPALNIQGEPKRQGIEIDATLTYSPTEVLSAKDFESMSAEEIAEAKSIIAHIKLPIAYRATRRSTISPYGSRIDIRATLRSALRTGGNNITLKRCKPRQRPPPLAVICDISGSMSQYSRMLLHFVHAMTSDRDRVHTFLFGTQLTNITRHLRHRDVDIALTKIGKVVQDWDGGTRIGSCLKEFNYIWSRRVLGQGAIVLLISDGLDRDVAKGLEIEMDRLHRSCRRLIWLNPLLRYDKFEAKSLGAAAMLPHVDEFRSAHNIHSLQGLATALGESKNFRNN